MSLDKEKYDLIDQYLKGDLSSEEIFAFEKEVGNNPELAEQLQLHQLADELSFEKGLVDIWEKVGQDLSQQPPPSLFYKKILMFFAGALILAGITIYYLTLREKEIIALPKSVTIKQVDQYDSNKAERSPEETLPENKANKKNMIGTEHKEKMLVVPHDTNLALKENLVASPKEDSLIKQQPVNTTPPVIPDKTCPEITFGVHTKPSCRNQENGSIQIQVSAIKGGEKPYSYSIDGNDFNLESFNNRLAKGIYQVKVKDQNGCVAQKQVEVHEKPCPEFKDYTFNPSLGNWKLPFLTGESGTITILDQSGKVVYGTKVISGVPEEWDGRFRTGEYVEIGTYLYIAEPEDKEIRQGYITIIY
ncbi:MAG: gliding motility-associated C-terminal domain-containing protein [Sporocytophaga sp.]|uniref:SprB repeat-containing protein n=1 Tax=Sporocytophaga sp. TaxID=2231183 RepID=UPI001B16A983|nr:SprB repeat-containing protein [Sporocytophaga sp.]MBO9701390.1 gliding motility-associated C-terminal domain-containing protein [Sporocytophaga sp.]